MYTCGAGCVLGCIKNLQERRKLYMLSACKDTDALCLIYILRLHVIYFTYPIIKFFPGKSVEVGHI